MPKETTKEKSPSAKEGIEHAAKETGLHPFHLESGGAQKKKLKKETTEKNKAEKRGKGLEEKEALPNSEYSIGKYPCQSDIEDQKKGIS